MTKHRAGRPRKAGPRQPCGHLKSSGAEPPSPAQIKRIQTGLLKSSTEQLLGDEVGRLYFHKLLTERQVSAAFRVADVYGRFERLHGRRRSSATRPKNRRRVARLTLTRVLHVSYTCPTLVL